MKKSTRVLSILLSFLMLFSAMSVGVTAAYTPYDQPGGYNSLGKPYLTIDQCGSIMLDYLDGILEEQDIVEVIDIPLFSKLTLDLTSVDKALDSIIRLFDSSLYSAGTTILNLKDIKKLNIRYIRQSPRRVTPGRSDLEVFYYLCKFLSDNKTVVGKIVDGTVDFGALETFGIKPDEIFGDIELTLKTALFEGLFPPEDYDNPDDPEDMTYENMLTNMSIDQLLNLKIEYMLVEDPVLEKEGFLPGMAGKLNIKTNSGYDIFKNAIRVAVEDIAVPKLTELLVDLLEIEITEEYPEGHFNANGEPVMNNSDLAIVWGLVIENEDIIYSQTALEKPVVMIEEALGYYLLGDFLKQFFDVTPNGVYVKDELDEALHSLLVMGASFLSATDMPGVTMKTPEQIELMNTQDLFAYLAKVLLTAFVDFSYFPESAQTTREVLTYFLINIATDLLPHKNYYSRIGTGPNDINPSTTGCLEVAAGLLRYYLNANAEMNVPDNLTFNQTIEHVVDWVLLNYGGIIYTGGMSADSAWKKIDKILFGNSPQLCGILQASWLPDTVDKSNITYDLLFNKIVFAIVDFDIEELVSIIRVNPTGDLNNSLLTIILNIVARVINGMFGNNTVIPLNLTSLDSLLTNPGLRNFVEAFIVRLEEHVEPICVSIFPILVDLLGLWDPSEFAVKAPEGNADVSISELENMLNSHVPKEQEVEYDEAGYVYFGSENYEPLYRFYDYRDVRREAERLIKMSEEDPESVTQQMITNTAYRLQYYFDELIFRLPNISNLKNFIDGIKADGLVKSNYTVSPSNPNYTLRTWNKFKRAYNFAYNVYVEVFIRNNISITQAQVTEARAQLVKAVKGLKDYVPLANYSLFYTELNRARGFTEEILSTYFEDTVENFLLALSEAENFDLDYDVDSQRIVDQITAKLEAAIEGLSYIPAIVAGGVTTILDKGQKLAYGFSGQIRNTSSYYSYIGNVGGGFLRFIASSNGPGTGTIINLELDGEIVDSYTVVIFGDLDGNVKIDATDAFYVSLLSNGLVNQGDLSAAQEAAADTNGDGIVDAADAYKLEMVGLFMDSIDQTR